MTINPKRIVCLSGKRKSGKDYVAEFLHAALPSSVIIRISAPIKQHWSVLKGLDMDLLMSNGAYKERYRAEMIAWGEEKRAEDSSFFCKSAIQIFNGHDFPIWIVSDLRRETDLKFFRDNYPEQVICIRLSASTEARVKRGFVHSTIVDESESETGLDHVQDWDLHLKNDGNIAQLKLELECLIKFCEKSC